MIEKVIITSLVCTAIHIILKPGMLLGWVGEILESFTNPVIANPLGLCLTCMASVYGLLMFVFWSGLPVNDLIPFILALAGLNYLVSIFISLIEILINPDENED